MTYVIVRSNARPRTAAPRGAPSLGGALTYAGDPLPNAGKVELWNAAHTLVLETMTVSATGHYLTTYPVINGSTYALAVHPTYQYAVTGESQFTDIVITGTTVRDFALELGYFTDNFQSYADSAALKDAATGFAGTSKTHCRDGGGNFNNAAQTTLTTDWPGGTKCMRYDWPARPSTCTGYSVRAASFHGNEIHTNLYLRALVQESNPFYTGATGCHIEYKYLTMWLKITAGGLTPAIVELQNGPTNYRFRGTTGNGGAGNPTLDTLAGQTGCTYPLPPGNPCSYDFAGSGFFGTKHVMVLEVLNVGSTSQDFSFYIDGVKEWTLTGNESGLSGGLDFCEWGANINDGPEAAQYRLFREVGIYENRPAMIDVL